jgi:hypothetical protein
MFALIVEKSGKAHAPKRDERVAGGIAHLISGRHVTPNTAMGPGRGEVPSSPTSLHKVGSARPSWCESEHSHRTLRSLEQSGDLEVSESTLAMQSLSKFPAQAV